MEKILLSIEDVTRLIPFSRGAIYKMVYRGRIPSKRLGRRIVFDPDDLRSWRQNLQDNEAMPAEIDSAGDPI